MPLRFHRAVRLLPGVRLNVGKTGASVTLGTHGVHETIGPTGVRTTVALPGTGLSYTHLARPEPGQGRQSSLPVLCLKLAAAIALLVLMMRYG